MKLNKNLRSLFLLFSMIVSVSVMADSYVVISKESKVFDDASPKYVTLNEDNEEVSLTPGMVFKTTEHVPGWYLIEYSPGLRGYVQEQAVASTVKNPQPGNYPVKNNPSQKISVQNKGDDWSAEVSGKNYKGLRFENILIFPDDRGNPAFSLVDLGSGPIVVTYDNALTKFF